MIEKDEATHRSEKKELNFKSVLLWVLVLCAIFVIWQNWPKQKNVPDELVGTWRSFDPMYADRFLEISTSSINFGTGEGTVTTGFIHEVKAVYKGDRTLYTISYVEGGNEQHCSLYYTSGMEETIRFKNQPNIAWVKFFGTSPNGAVPR